MTDGGTVERNEELFRKIADAIEAHPEHYQQEQLEVETDCGTAYCIAGWAYHLAGAQMGAEKRLGLSETAAWGSNEPYFGGLFASDWRPHDGLSVPDALRKIGEGAAIEDVSDPASP